MARIHHRHRDRLIKARGSICEICEKQASVEAHHMHMQRQGGSSDDDNLFLLCEVCHTITYSMSTKINWELIRQRTADRLKAKEVLSG